jgi:hypothetical protein
VPGSAVDIKNAAPQGPVQGGTGMGDAHSGGAQGSAQAGSKPATLAGAQGG